MFAQTAIDGHHLIEGNAIHGGGPILPDMLVDQRLGGIGTHHAETVAQVADGYLIVATSVVAQEYGMHL